MIVTVAHVHFFRLVPAIFLCVIALVGAVIAFSKPSTYMVYVSLAFAVGLVVALINLVYRLLKWYFQLLLLTQRRVLLIEGVLARRSREIPLSRINDITATQSLPGRLFGYGDLLIQSANAQGPELIHYIAHPTELASVISKYSSAYSDAPSTQGSSQVSPVQALEKLARLFGEGFLTREEFEQLKADILREHQSGSG